MFPFGKSKPSPYDLSSAPPASSASSAASAATSRIKSLALSASKLPSSMGVRPPPPRPSYAVPDLRGLYSLLLAEISLSTAGGMLEAWAALGGEPTADAAGVTYQPDQAALKAAGGLEGRAVELLRRLGEIVVYGEQNAAAAALFDYFCEKNMLALLVDVARGEGEGAGVARSVLVKAQVVQTVSILVQNVRNETSLYYLLSNNYVNELVAIPLQGYTDAALDEFMPTYISFLKALALRLSSSPTLFQFFVDELSGSTFPLFTAAVAAASSPYARTDSFVRLTALNIVVNVCKIKHDAIRRVIADSVSSQRELLGTLTGRFDEQAAVLRKLTAGASTDEARSDSTASAIEELQDQLYFINDLLQCGVRPLNVRLCEWLLRRCIFSPLMEGYRVRWKGDPADGSLDEWFTASDLTREYPEVVAVYEGTTFRSKPAPPSGAGGRRNTISAARRASALSSFPPSAPTTSPETARVLSSLFILSQFFLTFE
ncbi:hypothetical protein TeGR_g1466 [Tetraparma gracilis]|uniref:FPL domain-containing protein n=1 Tax=Tetraparma gracilis TaxID=2962635 RepID=A0ABQ6M607_9STRA|nr:hypothetical protein TeGR_g1466 [Tetraparma gracilis]